MLMLWKGKRERREFRKRTKRTKGELGKVLVAERKRKFIYSFIECLLCIVTC